MTISFHVNFNGQCAEAFQFYQNHLAGIAGPLLTYRDSPVSASVPDEWLDKVVHASITINDFELAGTDVVPDQYEIPMGFCLLIRLNSEEKVRALFDIFKQGGKVILPPQATFWSPCYAIVTDRFGIPWKFNCVV